MSWPRHIGLCQVVEYSRVNYLKNLFLRITKNELGKPIKRSEIDWHGIFEHLYANSYFGEGISTHYVVLACLVELNSFNLNPSKEQQIEYIWLSKEEIIASQKVHKYS